MQFFIFSQKTVVDTGMWHSGQVNHTYPHNQEDFDFFPVDSYITTIHSEKLVLPKGNNQNEEWLEV